MDEIAHKVLWFDRFALDLARGCLRAGDQVVDLRPKTFEVLRHLAESAGRLVPKQAFHEAVWRNVLVSDDSLVQCIRELRVKLGDTDHRLIKTVSRRGYLLDVPVAAENATPARPFLGTSAGADALPGLPLPDRPSIAVLPLDNMSGDPDQEYFADGISEDLITGLSRIRWLFVIARNSTFAYKRRAVDVKQVSRELGVRYVLEGSVRRAGKRLRISAQLIDAMTGGHHWAERYDRELGDMFAVQDEITRSVAAAIEPHLLAAEGVRALSRSSDDLGAWELVARAQTHLWRLTRPDYEEAVDALKRAVEAYPEYAPARSLLAYCLVFAAHMGWLGHHEALLASRQHAVRAVALDDRDAWAHIALGYLSLMERSTEESIATFHRAVNLNPNSAVGRHHLSHSLGLAGQDHEAIQHGEDAIRLSPLDPMMALFLGNIAVAHYVAGRYAEAAQYTTDALRLRPGFQGAQRLRCASLAQTGRADEARSFLAAVLCDQPQLSIDWIRTSVPYQTPVLMEHFLEGMRKAGLREK